MVFWADDGIHKLHVLRSGTWDLTRYGDLLRSRAIMPNGHPLDDDEMRVLARTVAKKFGLTLLKEGEKRGTVAWRRGGP